MFRVCLILLLSSVMCWTGCSASSDRVPVVGKVMFDGKPLESGIITFGGPRGAAGVSPIVNGEFSLSESGDRPGVLPGTYQVLVSSWIEERGSVREDGSFSPGITRIPLRYLDPAKSGLRAEVKGGAENRFVFELKSDGEGAGGKPSPR